MSRAKATSLTDLGPPVKKTVVIHPYLEPFIRKSWALLIDAGVDATYSSALNFMLVGFIVAANRQELPRAALESMWDFARDEKSLSELNLRDQLHHVNQRLRELEPRPKASRAKPRPEAGA
ncbi:MAG: hypothetical protein ACYDAY_11690 [Candidatus Dormibacteria bacterium]